MKKKLLSLLLLISILCTGCGEEEAPKDKKLPVSEQSAETEQQAELLMDPILEEYIANLDILESPVRAYGESVSYLQMEEDFVARILYPAGEVEALDQAVEDWVISLAEEYQAESLGSSINGDTAELTVDYSSYLVGESLVSVRLSGIYDRPYLAHPVDVFASFNADRETGALLVLEDVLTESGIDALRSMVAEDGSVPEHAVDEHLLDHWLLTPEGLEITLVRGSYLPMSDGTVVLKYDTDALEGLLVAAAEEQEALIEEEVQQPVLGKGEPAVLTPNKPMLALTFDDGPSAHTGRLLDVFAAHSGKGTFYVVGNMLDGRADTLRRMAEEGHEIGGHSWDHRQMTKLGEDELTDQLMNTRAKIYDITGVDAKTMRPPYGSCNDAVKSKAGELGIALINWSVDTLDWKNKDADMVYQAVMDGAKDGAIILCHDLHKTTVDAMERAIPALIAEGYQLVTVTELLGGTTPGVLYYKK